MATLFSEHVYVSRRQEDIVKPLLPPGARLRHLSNPIEAADLGPKTNPASGAVIFVGRLSPEKGASLFAEAAARAGVVPTFIGDGPMAAEMRRQYPQARFAGWLPPEQARAQMRAARALVFPSLWYEAQGLTILEAKAMGTPVIVSDVCAGRDEIDDGVNGLWFKSGDVDALAAALERIRDDSLVARFSQAAYESYWSAPQTSRSARRRSFVDLRRCAGPQARRRRAGGKSTLTEAGVKLGVAGFGAALRMVFAVAFVLNSAANFAFGVVLSALLGPAEFGRYATVALAATTLAGAAFGWLRLSSLRFSGESEGRARIAASLDAGYLGVMALLYLGVAVAALFGATLGASLSVLLLTPLLAVAFGQVDYATAQFRARDQEVAFAALSGIWQLLCFTAVIAVATYTHDSTLTIATLAITTLAAALALNAPMRTPGARLRDASGKRLFEFFVYAKPIVVSLVIYS